MRKLQVFFLNWDPGFAQQVQVSLYLVRFIGKGFDPMAQQRAAKFSGLADPNRDPCQVTGIGGWVGGLGEAGKDKGSVKLAVGPAVRLIAAPFQARPAGSPRSPARRPARGCRSSIQGSSGATWLPAGEAIRVMRASGYAWRRRAQGRACHDDIADIIQPHRQDSVERISWKGWHTCLPRAAVFRRRL